MSELIRCIIIDDEPLAIEVIKGYINQISQLELIGTFDNAISAFKVISEKNVDVLFLDIEMPDMTGLEFIESLNNPPAVILTTAHRKYALESYDVGAIDYLLKPISFSRFFKAINKYLKQSNRIVDQKSKILNENNTSGSIYVYSNKKNIKVHFDEIFYVESIRDYVRIHTISKNIISKDTISHYQESLPKSFLRVHRSYIVNTEKMTAYTQHDIEINEKEIPIGVSYKKRVHEFLKSLK